MKSYYAGPIGTHQRLFKRYHPDSLGLPFPKIGGTQPQPKLQSLLSQELVKLRTANLADTFTGPSEHKPIKNLGEKRTWAYPRTPNFFEYPYYRSEQKPIKNFGKSSRGRTQGLSKFFRAPIFIAHRAVMFAVAQLSCT